MSSALMYDPMEMKEKNYISQGGHDRLMAEYEHLRVVERPKITETVAWAAGNGDRSENADYIYGKKRLREIDRRLMHLSQRLDAAIIVDYTKNKDDVVRFGATVVLSDEEDQQRTYMIVGVDEINTDKNMISWKSPIGRAVMGKSIGDRVEVHTPQDVQYWNIEDVYYDKWD